MQTQLTPVKELQPGDKVYVEWPADLVKPEWHTLPDVLTVKEVFAGIVKIRESGGLCLEAHDLFKVIEINPVPGDTITFDIETFNEFGEGPPKECMAIVERTDFDPLKKREPKCIVTVDGEAYGIPFSEIKAIQKKQPQQLSMF